MFLIHCLFNTAFHLEICLVFQFLCYFLFLRDDRNEDNSICPAIGVVSSNVVGSGIREMQSGAPHRAQRNACKG